MSNNRKVKSSKRKKIALDLYNQIYIEGKHIDLNLSIKEYILKYLEENNLNYNSEGIQRDVYRIKHEIEGKDPKRKKRKVKSKKKEKEIKDKKTINKLLKENAIYNNIKEKNKNIDKKEFKKLYNKHINLIRQFVKLHEFINEVISNTHTIDWKETFELKKVNKRKKVQSCVINISDIHIGKHIESAEVGSLMEMNDIIVKERLNEYLNIAISKVNEKNINKIYINLIGDIIDGDSIYRGHGNFITDQLVHQIITAIEYLESFIVNLYKETKKQIELHCVYGNHGRRGKKGEFKYYNNFDYLIYKILEMRLKPIENIKFIIPLAWFDTYKIFDKEVLILHGDDINMWMGIPYYGIERMVSKFSHALNKFYDIIILGHFHTSTSLTLQGKDIILNGSFDGGDIFSLKKLYTMNKPSQWLFFISKDGIEERYKINFE